LKRLGYTFGHPDLVLSRQLQKYMKQLKDIGGPKTGTITTDSEYFRWFIPALRKHYKGTSYDVEPNPQQLPEALFNIFN
jgi:hypothetical protein